MSNELTVCATPGLSLTAKLLQGASVVASGIAVVESATPGFYAGSVPGGTPAGTYTVLFLAGSAPRAVGLIAWSGTAEVAPATQASVDAVKAKTDALPASPASTSDVTAAGAAVDPAAIAAAVLDASAGGDTVRGGIARLNALPPELPAIVIPGAPAVAGLCRVFGYLIAPDGTPAAGVTVGFSLVAPNAVGGSRLISGRDVKVTTDAAGQLVSAPGKPFVDLQRNDMLAEIGTQWEINCDALRVRRKLVTLEADLADLRDLLLA
jgi:hypothetical protein